VTDWAEIVGNEFAAPGGPGDRVDGVLPTWVIRPGSVAEVQAAVRSGDALVASGLGAHLDVGAPPRRLEVLVRLARLDRIVDHQAGDMTVTVEAGCPLSVLQDRLSSVGQWLPFDPPRPERTTVGGLVAANLGGPLRASQGGVRDLLLGLRVVGAGGTVTHGGGRVVKNVAGYDMPKLHVGALGSVGVLVEATFKVLPRPERETAVIVGCPTARVAADAALAVRDALDPLWIEIVGAGSLADAAGDGAAVAVGLGGLPLEVEHGCALVRELAASRGWHAVPVDDGRALRVRLGAFDVEPAAALLRAATLPGLVGATLEAVEEAGRRRGASIRTMAHAASGAVRISVARVDDVAPLIRELRPRLEADGGSVTLHRAGHAVKVAVDVWGSLGPGRELMRRIKDAFDPDGIFAPGRFVEGGERP
jgi:glycolate oxidase FAD binding subunit